MSAIIRLLYRLSESLNVPALTDMFQPGIMPVNGEVPNITAAQDFFASVPDGCFNLLCSFMTDLEDYKSLHVVIHKNKQCEPHWLKNLRKYAHRAEPLFDEFTSLEDLRFVLFDRKIDVRGWELHLITIMDHYGKGKHKYMTHGDSFRRVCEEGDVDVVKAVVERTQVDLGAIDDDGKTPLHFAAVNGHLPVVQYLCEQGADKEARDDSGRTPLYQAAFNCHLPVVQYLYEQGADKEARNEYDHTPLLWAAVNGHLPVVQYLCEQGANKEARGEYGRTPLLWAALNGHLPMVQYLCEQGADKEARDDGDKTSLHAAALKGHLPVVQYLCEQGADKKARDDNDWTPLIWASGRGHKEVEEFLKVSL